VGRFSFWRKGGLGTLAISRERKEELVGIYGELLRGTDGFIITENRGLNVDKMDDLRDKLRAVSGTYAVTKNTLFMIALRENGWVVPEELLAGPVAIAFGNGNLPAVAKVVQGYLKDNSEFFAVKGGVIANSVFQGQDLETISSLPTMEEIRAQLAGLIVQPAAQLAGILQAATSQVVNVIQAYLDDKNPPQAGEAA
jgi:large subunit ribosomal protein L10